MYTLTDVQAWGVIWLKNCFVIISSRGRILNHRGKIKMTAMMWKPHLQRQTPIAIHHPRRPRRPWQHRSGNELFIIRLKTEIPIRKATKRRWRWRSGRRFRPSPRFPPISSRTISPKTSCLRFDKKKVSVCVAWNSGIRYSGSDNVSKRASIAYRQ